MKTTITKRFGPFPAAHRQPRHDGHCAWVHGHNWYFDLTLTADVLDDCGFVLDVGKMESIKSWFRSKFDHTLLLNQDDPFLTHFDDWNREFSEAQKDEDCQLFKVVAVPDCSMEGLAKWVGHQVQTCLNQNPDNVHRLVRVVRVTCFEDEKNSATVEF